VPRGALVNETKKKTFVPWG